MDKQRVNFLTVSENASIKLAAEPIDRAFAGSLGCYHVGSSITTPNYRDIDIRMIMDDTQFEAIFGPTAASPACLDRWFLICWALSEWMQKRTGLPIDFQIQRQSEAQQYRGQPRNGLFFDYIDSK